MPVQSGQSGLLARYGNRLAQAHEAHKTDETSYSQFSELPAGIEDGIAQLVECKFDVFKDGKNKGEYFFYAAGVVVSPAEFTEKKEGGRVVTHRVEGLRTSIMEPLCDTPDRESRQSMDEHLAWIYNELRKLGVQTANMEPAHLEPTAAALKEAKPFFKFRTWKGKPSQKYPDPRTNHQWSGAVDFSAESSPADAVQDATGPAPAVNGQAVREAQVVTKNDVGTVPAGLLKPTAPPPGPTIDADGAIQELLQKAEAGDGGAQDQLTAMAVAAGVPETTVAAAPSWGAVVEMLHRGKPAAGGSAKPAAVNGAAPAEWTPEVGQIYQYKPINVKTKKPVQKAVDCEVTAVDKAAKTVGLKNLDNPNLTYAGVRWDDIEGQA